MKYKRTVTGNSITFSVALGVSAGILLQILGGVVVSLGVGRGVVAEETMGLTTHIIRALSMILATVLVWVTEKNKPFLASAVAAAIVLLVPIITAMLFWRSDGAALIPGIGVAILSFGLSAWGMSRQENKKNLSVLKKHYR